MVRNYVKKSDRQSWTEETMRLALEAVIKHGRSIRKAASEYQIPQATLSRKLSLCRGDPVKENELIANPKGKNLTTVFNKEQENLLCHYAATLQKQLIPFGSADIRKIAFQIAEKHKIPHRFKKDAGLAGEDWYRGFLKRNPTVSINATDQLFNKHESFTKRKVYAFFDALEDIIQKYHLEASDVYTCGETVITCAVSSDSDTESVDEYTEFQKEQRELVTAELCFSASGVFVPLLMIIPRKSKQSTISHRKSPGAWVEYDKSGQIQVSIFVKWLKKFIEFSKATKDAPVLLLLDAHQNFLKSLEVLELSDENGVHILCFPPHCSAKLHPMQHSFMQLLGESYTSEVSNWSNSHPGCDVSIHEVFNLFGSALCKVSSPSVPIDSFRDTGVWPPDRDRFNEEFAVPKTTNAAKKLSSAAAIEKPCASTSNEECQEMDYEDATDVRPKSEVNPTAHEPIVVITQNCTSSIKAINTSPMTNSNQVSDRSDSNIKQDALQYSCDDMMQDDIFVQAAPSNSHQQDSKSRTITIPPEAALTEVHASDLQQLMQARKDLYFYVSPYKLDLPPY